MSRTCALALLMLLATGAQAAVSCHVLSGGGVPFGPYDMLSTAPTDSQATVTITCERSGGPAGVGLMLLLDTGSNGSPATGRRLKHASSGDYLRYGLYQDPGRSSPWGNAEHVDAVSATLAVPDHGSASARFTIYGRIPPRQEGRVGTYSDAVQLTILY